MLYDRPIGERFDLQFDPTHAAASQARRQARRLLDDAGVPPAAAADVELIIAELASNAVEQDPAGLVRLEVALVDGAVHLTVANRSRGRPTIDLAATPDPQSGRGDDVLADRGRGLRIVRALSDDLRLDHDEGWTSISCLVRFDRSAD